jgi:maleylacetoacetate isomerase
MPDSGTLLTLYDYWRSSASYRVRIALHLKGLEFSQHAVNLVADGGQQHSHDYRALNPQGLVPVLVHGEKTISQSQSICEYLEAVFPETPLLPEDPLLQSVARAMALTIACDIHPLNNLRVQQYLKGRLNVSTEDTVSWMNHWVSLGFESIEARLQAQNKTSLCSMGDEPGLVECFLIPQVYNAERFECDLSNFPEIRRITAHCRSLPAFMAAAPEVQPDAPKV